MRRMSVTLMTLAALCCAGGAAEAGVVVLERGDVIVGGIAPTEVTAETITLRWPHGERRDKGEMTVKRHEVRWFDVEADAPTDAYFAAHLDAPLKGGRWLKLREEYLIRQRGERDPIEVPPPPWVPPHPLDPLPVEASGFTLRKPREWTVAFEQGITVLLAPKPLANGYRPRVHVFAVRAAGAPFDDQVSWIRGALGEMTGAAGFEVTHMYRLRQVAGGADQRLVTETLIDGRKVVALRQVSFRGQRTYLFSAYADAADFEALRRLFEMCLESLRIAEDAQG